MVYCQFPSWRYICRQYKSKSLVPVSTIMFRESFCHGVSLLRSLLLSIFHLLLYIIELLVNVSSVYVLLNSLNQGKRVSSILVRRLGFLLDGSARPDDARNKYIIEKRCHLNGY